MEKTEFQARLEQVAQAHTDAAKVLKNKAPTDPISRIAFNQAVSELAKADYWEAIGIARDSGYSWHEIGTAAGTSGDYIRQAWARRQDD